MVKFNQALTDEDIKKMHQNLEMQPNANLISSAIRNNGLHKVAENADIPAKLNRTFSIDLKTGTVSNQKRSGRCWIFSLTNTLRHQFAEKYQQKNFELSQGYLFFWDKIERANIFYDRMIASAHNSTYDRDVQYYLTYPNDDGGQWAMAAGLVEKYGLVPKESYPETIVTEDTSEFEAFLAKKLRHDAIKLRDLVNDEVSDKEIEETKEKFLSEVYRIVAYSFGEPPTNFNLEYRDDKENYHLDQNLTPRDFYQKYFDTNMENYVVLSNAPDRAYNRLYALPSQNNIVGGKQIQFVNAPMDVLKSAVIKQLKDGTSVWFGNDVIQQMHRQKGILDSNLYRQAELFGLDTSMSKADRLKFHEAEVSHAMTLTGVDLIDGESTKWKVENSWGEKVGEKGYFVMSDEWMNDFVYEVVVNKKYIPKEQLDVLNQAPIKLENYDSLA